MKYKITYDFNSNSLEDPNELYIYDFGYLKAFIFNSDINVYRIIEKKENFEIIEEFDGVLPLDLISLEKYKCNYKNNNYITENFVISLETYLDTNATVFDPNKFKQTSSFQKSSQQPSQQLPLLPQKLPQQSPLLSQKGHYQQKHNNKKVFLKNEKPHFQKENSPIKVMEQNLQHNLSNSWISLDQILQVHQSPKIQPPQHSKQQFPLKKHHSFSHVRQDRTQL